MKAVKVRGQEHRRNPMTQLITLPELETLSETELRAKFSQILDDLARKGSHAQECPLTMLTLRNIQEALRRKRAKRSRFTPMP
jgi:hypothetical protein